MVFYHKGLRVRKTPLPFVACARKAAILHVQIWSEHESDVVGLTLETSYAFQAGPRSWQRPPPLPLHHPTALQHRRHDVCEGSDVMLSGHTWPRRSARPMIASHDSHRRSALQGYLLQTSSTSAGRPILYGRILPRAGARPKGTETFLDARPLRSQ